MRDSRATIGMPISGIRQRENANTAAMCHTNVCKRTCSFEKDAQDDP